LRPLPTHPDPAALTEGRVLLRSTPGIGTEWYDRLGKTAKDAVRDQRLREQGYFCAYTEIRLADRFHIEHMYAQDHCDPEEKVDYSNLVLCFPDSKWNPGFGAVEKGNWPDRSQRAQFIRALDPSCATRFRYENDGRMTAKDPSNSAAAETIRRLKLDEPPDPDNPTSHVLRKRRAETISATLLSLKTATQARKSLESMRSTANANGRLPEFVSARRESLERYIKRLEDRIKYSRRA